MSFKIVCGSCGKETVFDKRYDETNGKEHPISMSPDYDGLIYIECVCGNKREV